MGRLQAEGLTASRARHNARGFAAPLIRAGLRPETLDTLSMHRNTLPEQQEAEENGAHTNTVRTLRRRSA